MNNIANYPLVNMDWSISPLCRIYVSMNRVSIGSDNGLSPIRRQAIIQTSAGLLLIGPSGTNISELLVKNRTFPFKKMHLKMSSAKWGHFVQGKMSQCIDKIVLAYSFIVIYISHKYWLAEIQWYHQTIKFHPTTLSECHESFKQLCNLEFEQT